jgi:quinoprotein glucose dehydrogenase
VAIANASKASMFRLILAGVLGIIALVLIIGGIRLAGLGGSYYYLAAGLTLAGSAWLTCRNDRRAMGLYGLMLIGTLLWTLAETGLNPWQLQVRLFAPTVLGIWVFWPWLGQHARSSLTIGILILCGFGGWLWNANQLDAAPNDVPAATAGAVGDGEWLAYGNDAGGTRFSPLTQINAANIGALEPAWTFRTGDKTGIGFQVTPLMIEDTVYLCSPRDIIFALDAETGAQRWKVDPKVDAPDAGTCRGVAYFKQAGAAGLCAERIIIATTDARLLAVDRKTGQACTAFGSGGSVDLKHRMGTVNKGYYYVSSAPTIVRGKIVLGGWVTDGQYVGEPSGVIRAFDAITGKFAWAWDVDRPDDHGEPKEGTAYSPGTPNSWGPMSGDEALGMVFLPTGNSTPDYWGAHRSPGSEKFSSSVVALDAETGKLRWSFQAIHHDLWDYDVSAQPTLIDLPIGGTMIPALIQATKNGNLFVLDRRNGKPLAPVEERKVPQAAAQGDFLSPTQPFTADMPTFDNTVLSEEHMWGLTPLDQLWCKIKFREARYDGPFTPPNVKPSITYPSYLGGINWGGVSVDPQRKLLVANWSRMANYTRLVPRKEADAAGLAASQSGGGQHVGVVGQPVAQKGTPFAALTAAFLSPIAVPCTEPPFGKIAVVDLVKRKIVWENPLGTSADSGPYNIRTGLPLPMGVPNSGGTMTTRSGLIFVAATQERAIRAYTVNSGKLVWKAQLPAGGHAAPMSYISPKTGRQFIVIAAGGNVSLHSGADDAVVAFALRK